MGDGPRNHPSWLKKKIDVEERSCVQCCPWLIGRAVLGLSDAKQYSFLCGAQGGGMVLSLVLPASGPLHVSFGYQMSSVEIVSERSEVLKLLSFGL